MSVQFSQGLVWLGVTQRNDRYFVWHYSASVASTKPATEFASVEALRSWLQDGEFRPYPDHPSVDVALFEAWH